MDSQIIDIDKIFNKRLGELNVVFRPLTIETIQLGRLVAFELIKDSDGIRFYTSTNIQEELGYSLEEFYLDVKVKDFLDFETFSTIITNFYETIKKMQHDFIGEFKFKDSYGEIRWGHLYVNVQYKRREWKSISGYALDITNKKVEEEKLKGDRAHLERLNSYIEMRINDEVERRMVQERINEASKRHSAVSETIEKIAHQWRQPLNIVSLLLQDFYFKINLGNLYPKGEKDAGQIKSIVSEKYNELYDKANGYIQYLSETVDDFRKQIANQDGEREYFNLHEFIKEIKDFVGPSLERGKIKLVDNVKFDYVEMHGVKNNLKQTVINIIQNSFDIFRERNFDNREIILNVYFDQTNKLVIAIADNAGGIPKDIMSQIFDPYFTTRHETQGTGLGLYMSREMIQRGFDGNIFAVNRSICSNCRENCSKKELKRDGACFLIEIPKHREV